MTSEGGSCDETAAKKMSSLCYEEVGDVANKSARKLRGNWSQCMEFELEYAESTDSADTVRMCCSSTDTVLTSAMFRRIYSLPI